MLEERGRQLAEPHGLGPYSIRLLTKEFHNALLRNDGNVDAEQFVEEAGKKFTDPTLREQLRVALALDLLPDASHWPARSARSH